VPNIREMNASNRQLTAANELVATFHHARNTAITLSRNVRIDATGGNWRNGWTVTALAYTAVAPDGTITSYPVDLLSSHDALSGQLTLSATSTSFTYDRLGRLVGAGTISVCDDRTAEKGRSVSLDLIGRVSISTTSCS
jgi:Tfp pilus assembly protein FimT